MPRTVRRSIAAASRRPLGAIGVTIALATTSAAAGPLVTFTWRDLTSTGSTDTNWATGTNWSSAGYANNATSTSTAPAGNDVIVFANNFLAGTAMTNNLAVTDRYQIRFDADASVARTINGTATNAFADFGGLDPRITNNSAAAHTLNFPIAVANAANTQSLFLDATNGDLTFGSTFRADGGGSRRLAINANAGRNVTLGGILSDGTSVNAANRLGIDKNGNGVLTITTTLSNTNTYSSGTVVNAGSLRANNVGSGTSATGSGNVSVKSGATLGGSGEIHGGTITIESGATVTAGGSDARIGSLNTDTQRWLSGGKYLVKFNDGNGSVGGGASGIGWDKLTIATLDASTLGSTSKFTVKFASYSGSGGTLVPGTAANFANTAAHHYLIAHVGALTPSTANLTSLFTLDTSAFTNQTAPGWAFSLSFTPGSGSSGDLYVDYKSTPEPTTTLLFGLGSVCLLSARRRTPRVG